MEPIKLILVDSEEVFREGLARLLKEQSSIEIVCQCSTGKDAISKSSEANPHVVLIEDNLPDCNTFEIIENIRKHSPGSRIAMISRPDRVMNPVDAIKAGARACLAKNISVDDLIKSIELISSGRIIISPQFAEQFVEGMSGQETPDKGKDISVKTILSQRELEIAVLIAEGATNKEIAEKLVITENTAKVHVKNILNKLELKNRQQLAVYAVMKEWVKSNLDSEK